MCVKYKKNKKKYVFSFWETLRCMAGQNTGLEYQTSISCTWIIEA